MGADHRPDLGDEHRVGAEDLAALVDQAPAVSGSWMCWTTQASRPASLRSRANSTMRSNARRRVRTRSTGRDLLLEGEDRLDLQGRAEPAPAPSRSARPGAGTRACRSRTTSSATRGRAPRPRAPRRPMAPRCGGARGGQHHQALAAAGRAAVEDVDPLAALAGVDQRCAGLERPSRRCPRSRPRCGSRRSRGRRRAAARRRAMKSPTEGCEVRRALLAASQPLVEVVVVVGGDLALALLLAVERDVEADHGGSPCSATSSSGR